jgi:hypothetical protein
MPVLQTPPGLTPPTAPNAGAPFGATISDITGQERPQAITPGASATQGLQESAQAAAQRALENPSPYDDELFKQETERGREALNEDLAARGLDYSTFAPELYSKRVLQPLLSERARGIADARAQALQGAQSVIGQRTGYEAQGREELRGERGYVDQLREQARQQDLQRYALEQDALQRALQAFQGGAAGLGGAAGQYGAQAEASGQGLQDLAQLFARTFYGGQQ